jgi:hypothetical protein
MKIIKEVANDFKDYKLKSYQEDIIWMGSIFIVAMFITLITFRSWW